MAVSLTGFAAIGAVFGTVMGSINGVDLVGGTSSVVRASISAADGGNFGDLFGTGDEIAAGAVFGCCAAADELPQPLKSVISGLMLSV